MLLAPLVLPALRAQVEALQGLPVQQEPQVVQVRVVELPVLQGQQVHKALPGPPAHRALQV